jgi:hypothetical protein
MYSKRGVTPRALGLMTVVGIESWRIKVSWNRDSGQQYEKEELSEQHVYSYITLCRQAPLRETANLGKFGDESSKQ